MTPRESLGPRPLKELTVDDLKKEFARFPFPYHHRHWIRNGAVRRVILETISAGRSLAEACVKARLPSSQVLSSGTSWAYRLFKHSIGPTLAIQRVLEAIHKNENEIFPEEKIESELPVDVNSPDFLALEAERLRSQVWRLEKMLRRKEEALHKSSKGQAKLSNQAAATARGLHEATRNLIVQRHIVSDLRGALQKAEEGKRAAEKMLELAHKRGVVDALWDRLQRAVIDVYAQRIRDLTKENEHAGFQQKGRVKAESTQQAAVRAAHHEGELRKLQLQVAELESALGQIHKKREEAVKSAPLLEHEMSTPTDKVFSPVKHFRQGVAVLETLLQDSDMAQQLITLLSTDSGLLTREVAENFCKMPKNIELFSQSLMQYMRSKNIRNSQELLKYLQTGRHVEKK